MLTLYGNYIINENDIYNIFYKPKVYGNIKILYILQRSCLKREQF